MSDDEEYEYDYGSEEDYGSDGGMMEEGEDGKIQVENTFYEAEDLRSDSKFSEAIEMFQKCITLEEELGSEVKYRFRALQHIVTMCNELGKYEEMVARYRSMLDMMSLVTPNERTDAINIILDSISALSSARNVLTDMYEITLEALKSANNERLWFNTNQKLAGLYIETQDLDAVEEIIKKMKKSCQLDDGSDDQSKGTYLLEVYNLEIQLCSATQDAARMRKIYPKTLNLNAAVSDPRVMGVIREEGGKMYMTENNWADGCNELSEAFRAYQEAGNARAKTCLKYLIVASMLAVSPIDPLAAPEAKVFVEDKEIMAMRDLRLALDANDLVRFERTLRDKGNKIIDEPFLMKYIDPLHRRMHEQVLLNVLKPYKRVKMQFLADQLHIESERVENILIAMILDRKIEGVRIDQIHGVVVLEGAGASQQEKKLQSISKWASSLDELSGGFQAKLSTGVY